MFPVSVTRRQLIRSSLLPCLLDWKSMETANAAVETYRLQHDHGEYEIHRVMLLPCFRWFVSRITQKSHSRSHRHFSNILGHRDIFVGCYRVQFPIQVCFSVTVGSPILSSWFPPVTLNFDL